MTDRHATSNRVRCSSYSRWHARCTLVANHDGWHEDDQGAKWANPSAFPDGRNTPDRVQVELDREMAVYLRYTDQNEWNYESRFALDEALDKALGDA